MNFSTGLAIGTAMGNPALGAALGMMWQSQEDEEKRRHKREEEERKHREELNK